MTARTRLVLIMVAAALVPWTGAGVAGGQESARAAVVTSEEVVGTSVHGRPVVAIHRATEATLAAVAAGAPTRTLLVLGSMHGDEQAGTRVVRRLANRPWLPAGLDLWLVPTVNPDGAAAHTRTNARMVDLNRNFPYRWRAASRGPTWSGPAPLSEPESRALNDLVRRVKPDLILSFHQPLFGVGANEKGMRTIRALAAGMRLPVDRFVCTGVCHGTFAGWFNKNRAGLAVTVEFGRTVPGWQVARAARTAVDVAARGPLPGQPVPPPLPSPTPPPPPPAMEPTPPPMSSAALAAEVAPEESRR